MSTRTRANTLKAAMAGMAARPLTEPNAQPAPTGRASPLPPSRLGKRVVSAYVAAEAAKQLRLLAADLDSTTQELVEEALNDLFRKHNRSAVA